MKFPLFILLIIALAIYTTSASTTAQTVVWFSSAGDDYYDIRICNHLDGCAVTEPDTPHVFNVTKDYTIELVPKIYNLTQAKTYYTIMESRFIPFFYLVMLGVFILGLAYLVNNFVGGKQWG